MDKKNVVVMGGGTGMSMVLKSLVDFPVDLSAVISTMDDGGSSGRLLTQLGVATAPGDIRLCLLALSKADPDVRTLFGYRFADGELKGHTVGNLVLSAAEKSLGSFEQGLKTLHQLLQVHGKVVPVTLDRTTLGVRHGTTQTELLGEHVIDDCTHLERPRSYFLSPAVTISEQAKQTIAEADVLILGPGSFSTSLIPVLIVEGVRETIAASKAKIIINANLTTTPGQSDGQTILEMVEELQSYLPRPIDRIVYHNQPLPNDMLTRIEAGSAPTTLGEPTDEQKQQLVGANLMLQSAIQSVPGDPIVRKAIGHDPKLLGPVLFDLIETL